MKSILQAAVLILFFCASINSQTTHQDSNRIVSVLSFNILHGATTKGDFDLDAIAKVILDTDPDFVALQEVDFLTNRARNYDLVTELAYRTKMAPLFGRAMKYDGGEYGEGILSKYSFVSTKNHALPYNPGDEPRAALEIITVLPSNDTISFIGTHLDHLSDESNRIQQAQKLQEVFSKPAYPSILAGDLNAEPNSKPMKILEKIWTPTHTKGKMEFTYSSENPRKKIDYILYQPLKSWKVLESRAICDTIASDHCAYFSVLQLL